MIGLIEHIDQNCNLLCHDCEDVFASEEVYMEHKMMYGCLSEAEREARGIVSLHGVWQADIPMLSPNMVGGPLPTMEEYKALHERMAQYMAKFDLPESARMEGASS